MKSGSESPPRSLTRSVPSGLAISIFGYSPLSVQKIFLYRLNRREYAILCNSVNEYGDSDAAGADDDGDNYDCDDDEIPLHVTAK